MHSPLRENERGAKQKENGASEKKIAPSLDTPKGIGYIGRARREKRAKRRSKKKVSYSLDGPKQSG